MLTFPLVNGEGNKLDPYRPNVALLPTPQDHNQIIYTSLLCTHYKDLIISPMASQITSLTIVYSGVYSGADQRKLQSSASLAFVREFTGEFPAQRASNAENVSI